MGLKQAPNKKIKEIDGWSERSPNHTKDMQSQRNAISN